MSASLSNEEIEDRYFLLGQVEILSILNDLAHRREPVSIYFNGGQNFTLSLILSARPDGLVFDLGGDPKTNALLEKAPQCVFMAFPDGIRVQFTGYNPQKFMWGDEAAFWVPVPERIIRLQRRENFRNLLPIANPFRVKLSDEDGDLIANWPIHDLSVGGFGVVIEGEPKFKIGDTIPQVWITLSPKSNLHCPAVVRHITFIEKTKNGRFQIGFDFVNLPHAMDIAVQRTIISIEYERRRLVGS
ncbi:flagellar brake protein [Undibacterium fentianense]|uniref:Flagellar brake protein YcgR n=1 Tax=Undibacterium fentianense TaxID=2828728 RepID=A0A941E2T9_9BURK|nr:flagellar brake protein [Undibacterium fentianense]MBR7801325.1 flagellar brake protein [Undibacterium fentianense]